jgi:hypothetical protein
MKNNNLVTLVISLILVIWQQFDPTMQAEVFQTTILNVIAGSPQAIMLLVVNVGNILFEIFVKSKGVIPKFWFSTHFWYNAAFALYGYLTMIFHLELPGDLPTQIVDSIANKDWAQLVSLIFLTASTILRKHVLNAPPTNGTIPPSVSGDVLLAKG